VSGLNRAESRFEFQEHYEKRGTLIYTPLKLINPFIRQCQYKKNNQSKYKVLRGTSACGNKCQYKKNNQSKYKVLRGTSACGWIFITKKKNQGSSWNKRLWLDIYNTIPWLEMVQLDILPPSFLGYDGDQTLTPEDLADMSDKEIADTTVMGAFGAPVRRMDLGIKTLWENPFTDGELS
jgi:hypothetical protein